MPPTESQILSHFLLPPATLPAVISLRKFIELFPPALRSNPQIPVLYRELQHQRAIDVDDVRTNISNEVKKGDRQRREIARARRREEGEDDADGSEGIDAAMEVELFGPSKHGVPGKPHTTETVLNGMREACEDIEAEITAMETEAADILADLRKTIDDLSDLRYGRLQRVSGVGGDPVTEVIEGLSRLETLCGPNSSHANGAD